MATLNKVMLMGRLTANPEPVKAFETTGTRIIKFRFAVGRSKKNPQTGQWENDPNPLYIDCEAFSKPDAKRDLVTLIQQYCKQGDSLYIEGRLVFDQWTDNATQQKRSKHKVVVESLEFLGGKSGGGEDGGEGGGQRSYGGGGGGEQRSYGGGGGSRAVSPGGGRPAPARGGYSAPDDGDDYDNSPPPPPRGGRGAAPAGGGGDGGNEDIPF